MSSSRDTYLTISRNTAQSPKQQTSRSFSCLDDPKFRVNYIGRRLKIGSCKKGWLPTTAASERYVIYSHTVSNKSSLLINLLDIDVSNLYSTLKRLLSNVRLKYEFDLCSPFHQLSQT